MAIKINQEQFNKWLRSIGFRNNKLYSSRIELYADLSHTINLFEIEHQPAFLAQIAYESAYFSRAEENLNYSARQLHTVFNKYFKHLQQAHKFAYKPRQIGNIVYHGRLGNNKPGDGNKYKGRSLIQLTGKRWYRMISKVLGIDFVKNPQLLAKKPYCCYGAGYFWVYKNLDKVRDFKKITRIINGGLNGFEKRLEIYEKILKVFPKNSIKFSE